MFSSVVSTQELLSDSQRSSYSNDSALFSLSQRQHSQSEFSQVRTQDMFTQKVTGSQTESSCPAGKKMSMYEKWMSKGSLFSRRDPPRDSCVTGAPQPANRVDMSSRQQAARKEKQDRDLLQQVVNIVQECNKEVKIALGAVKDRLDSQTDSPLDKTNDMLKAFLEDLWKHEEHMMRAVEESNDNASRLAQLEKQLAVKEAEVQHLQKQLKEQDQQDVKLVAKAVRQEMLSPQAAMTSKLQEILEVTRETSEQQSHQLDQYKQHMTAHTKQYKEWKTSSQKLIKDTEKRLQKEISGLRTAFQQQEEMWQSRLQDQLSETNSAQFQDIEHQLDHILTQISTSKTTTAGRQGTDTAVQSAISGLKKEIQNCLQKQVKTLENSVQDLLTQQVQSQQDQLQTLQTSLLADLNACVNSAMEEQLKMGQEQGHECVLEKMGQGHRYGKDTVTPLTLPEFEGKFAEYHQDLKHQLEDMHHKHVEEVLKLQQEMKSQDPDSDVSTALVPFTQSQLVSTHGVFGVSQGSAAYQQKSAVMQQEVQTGTNLPTASTNLHETGSWGKADRPFPSSQFHARNTTKPFSSNTDMVKTYGLQTVGQQRQVGKGLARISPLSKQEKASLFSRPKTSPVAAVIPQRQPARVLAQNAASGVSSQTSQTVSQSVSSGSSVERRVGGMTHSEQPQPAAKVWKRENSPPQKKKKGGRGKSRPRGRKALASSAVRQDVEKTSQDCQQAVKAGRKRCLKSPCSARGVTCSTSVHEFADDTSPFQGLRDLENLNSQINPVRSPSQTSDTSHLSSPAMSITEVVFVRRSRWPTRPCVQPLMDAEREHVTGKEEGQDILSTPYLEGTTSQNPRQQQLTPGPQRETRSTAKRRR